MTDTPIPLTKNPEDTFSASKIREFVSCQRRYKYKYVDRLAPRIYQRALEFGTIGHHFLEQWYISLRDGTTYDVLAIAEDIKRERGLEGFDSESLQMFENDVFTACGMIEAYIKHYAKDAEKYEVLMVEEKISYSSKINGKILNGVPDLILKERNSNHVWIADHKFLAQVSDGLVKKLPLDYQIHAYLKMGKEWLTQNRPELFLRGAIYNIVRKPSKRLKKGQTLKEYQQELFLDYSERPDEFFFREMPIVTDKLIANFDSFLEIVTEDMTQKHASGKFLQNIFACDVYGTCPYLELCLYGDASKHLYKDWVKERKESVK